MASRWIVKRKDKEQGPFSSQQLKKLADSGQLRTTDWVRKDDSDQFVKAEKVKGLFDPPPSKDSTQSRERSRSPEMLVAEVVEVVEEAPPEKRKTAAEAYENDFDLDDAGYEDYGTGDFDDFDEFGDYEEPAPRRSASRGISPPSRRGRGEKSRRSSSQSQPKKTKARIKQTSSDDDEDGPWQNLFGGFGCIALGVGLFLAIGPEGVEITGFGIVTWVLMLLNYIGGRWAILVFCLLAALGCFLSAYEKFTER